jgi:hypothetical protein
MPAKIQMVCFVFVHAVCGVALCKMATCRLAKTCLLVHLQPFAATAIMVPGGAEKLADGRNSLDIDHSAKVLKSVVTVLLMDTVLF